MEEIKPDNVNHPAHYEVGGYECEKIMEAVFGKDQVAIWSKLNAFKYLWRCDHKDSREEDIGKACWYLNNYLKLTGKRHDDWSSRGEEDI